MAKSPFTDLLTIGEQIGGFIDKAISKHFDKEEIKRIREAVEEHNRTVKKEEDKIKLDEKGNVSTAGASKVNFPDASGYLRSLDENVVKIAKSLGATGAETADKKLEEWKEKDAKAKEEETKAADKHTEATKGNIKAIKDEIQSRREAWKNIKEGFKGVFNVLKGAVTELLDAWGKVDQAAFDFAKRIGGNAAMATAQRANTIQLVYDRHIGAKYNTSADELIGLQSDYSANIGRKAAMTNDELETLAAMNGFMGKDRTEEFAKAFELFGKNIEGTGTAVGKLYKDASDRGIAFEKYSQNVLNNIKLAQSYNFANGMRGLEDMARKATMLKIDMQQIAQLADKVSTVEGATSTAANLSVLGGSFSAFANPMAMLYEGLNDINSLQDRVVNQFGNLAFFDKAKGEINMEAFDKQRVRAAAQAMGMNSDQLMDMIFTNARINQIQPELDRLNVKDETKDLIKNQVQIDKDGTGYVMLNGQKRKVNELTEGDAEALKKANQSDSDNIKEITETLRGWNDSVSGTEKQYETMKAQLAESTGLGDTAKDIVQAVGESNKWLAAIFGAVTFLGVAGPLAQLGRGLFGGGLRAGGGFGGKVGGAVSKGFLGKGVTSTLASGGRVGLGGRIGGAMGSAAAIGGGVLAGGLTAYNEFTGENRYKHGGWEKGGRILGSGVGAWGGAATGAALLSFLGPVGALVGGLAGGIIGAIGGEAGGGALGRIIGMSKSEKADFKKHYHMEDLLGDYTADELQDILAHRDEGKALDKDLHAKLMRNGDGQYLEEGGIVGTHIANGPLHKDGGIKGVSRATGKLVEFEGGELVLSREDTKAFLQAMQSWKEAASAYKGNEFKPVDVKDRTVTRNEVSGNIKLDPLDIRINGTIRLETPAGQNTNLNFDELLKNRQFVDKLTDLMYTEIRRHTSLGKNGETNYKKYV